MSRDELMKMLKDQIAVEESTIGSISKTVRRSKNSLVRLLLHGLVLGSMKHVDMLQALMDMVSGKVVSDVETYEVGKEIDGHVKNEVKMLRRIEEVVSKAKDEKVKGFLENILRDERKHHEMLGDLLSIVAKGAQVSDEELWQVLGRWDWLF